MPGPLDRLVSENQSIAGSASVSGSQTPLTPVGAVGVGANQDAAKMAGTKDQKQAAMVRNLRESTPESAMAVFQQAQAPQKSQTLKDLEAAREKAKMLSNLGGRVVKIAEQKVADAAKAAQFPLSDVVNVQSVSASFPGSSNPQTLTDSLLAIFNKVDLPKEQYAKEVDKVRSSMKPGEFDKLGGIEGIRAKLFTGKVPTDGEISSKVLGNLSPEVRMEQLTNPSVIESIGGPGYTQERLAADIEAVTGKPYNPKMTWGEASAAIKTWQQKSLTDYNELTRLAGSKNPSVQAEAQQRLRELGYFGGESFAAEVASLKPEDAAKVPVNLPGMEGTTLDDVLQGNEKGKQALVTIAGRLQSDPKSLDGVVSPIVLDALKGLVEDAKNRGTLSDMDIQGWKAGEENLAANQRFWMTDAAGGAAGLDANGLEAVIPGYKDMIKAGGLLSAADVNNPAFQVFKDPTVPEGVRNNLRLAFAEAAKNPRIAEALRSMGREQLMRSALVVDPVGVSNRLAESSMALDLLQQSKTTGNADTQRLFLTKVFGEAKGGDYDQVIQNAIKAGIKNVGNVALTKPGPMQSMQVLDNKGRPTTVQVPGPAVPRSAFEIAQDLLGSAGDVDAILNGANPLSEVRNKFNLGKVAEDTARVEGERKAKETQDNQDFERYFRAPNSPSKVLVQDSQKVSSAPFLKHNWTISALYNVLSKYPNNEKLARETVGNNIHDLHKAVLESKATVDQLRQRYNTVAYEMRNNKKPETQQELASLERQIKQAEDAWKFVADLSNAKKPSTPPPKFLQDYMAAQNKKK